MLHDTSCTDRMRAVPVPVICHEGRWEVLQIPVYTLRGSKLLSTQWFDFFAGLQLQNAYKFHE